MSAKTVSHPPRAFSLLELLSVLAVIALMVSLTLPAISGYSRTAGRRGALNVLMNTFEQARVAALAAGRPAYVLLWRREFPESDAIMVLREPESSVDKYEQLTKWTPLPKGVLLHHPNGSSSMLSASAPTSVFDPDRRPTEGAGTTGGAVNVLVFNASGGVSFPVNKAERQLIVSEGVRGPGGSEALIAGAPNERGFEIISVSPFTGRAQRDVVTAP